MIKVCKFGGTSMADGMTMRRVKDIFESDPERRYIVVSAPGKRFSGDIKVTDLLYETHKLRRGVRKDLRPFFGHRAGAQDRSRH